MKPELINYIDTSEVKELCTSYITNLSEGKETDKNIELKVFFAALKAFYGRDIFQWIDDTIEKNSYVNRLMRDLNIE